jgi:hypothetical protein
MVGSLFSDTMVLYRVLLWYIVSQACEVTGK